MTYWLKSLILYSILWLWFSFLHDINAAHRVVVMWLSALTRLDVEVMWCVGLECLLNPPRRHRYPGRVLAAVMRANVCGYSGDLRRCRSRWIWRNLVCWWELPGGAVWPWSFCTPCTPPASAPGPPSEHFYSRGGRQRGIGFIFMSWRSPCFVL